MPYSKYFHTTGEFTTDLGVKNFLVLMDYE